jgi:hypothetical protein
MATIREKAIKNILKGASNEQERRKAHQALLQPERDLSFKEFLLEQNPDIAKRSALAKASAKAREAMLEQKYLVDNPDIDNELGRIKAEEKTRDELAGIAFLRKHPQIARQIIEDEALKQIGRDTVKELGERAWKEARAGKPNTPQPPPSAQWFSPANTIPRRRATTPLQPQIRMRGRRGFPLPNSAPASAAAASAAAATPEGVFVDEAMEAGHSPAVVADSARSVARSTKDAEIADGAERVADEAERRLEYGDGGEAPEGEGEGEGDEGDEGDDEGDGERDDEGDDDEAEEEGEEEKHLPEISPADIPAKGQGELMARATNSYDTNMKTVYKSFPSAPLHVRQNMAIQMTQAKDGRITQEVLKRMESGYADTSKSAKKKR